MKRQWWHSSVVYQIYPKSFYDTNNDGIGDINGIIEKLDYLKELGVDVIWLTPIYSSPQKDNGYDISDYYNISELYGTMEEFHKLLDEVHKRNMKLIMDIVVNHTSIEHEWFKKSRSKESGYEDFYIWKDPVNGKEPNNWLSKFGGTAWEYCEERKQYYLHLFDKSQADLNWENENLRKEIYKMINWWLKKGVDGFRLDVVNLISKDQRFLDDDGNEDDMLPDGRKYYTDGPKVHEYLKEMNEEAFYDSKLLTVGEMSSTSLENCIRYSNPEEKELSMVFSFHHLKVDYTNGEKWTKAPFDFIKLKKILSKWQKGMYEGNGWNALFWSNHDQPRAISRFGDDGKYHDESGKMLCLVAHGLQGTPYIYQGEEIGMTNPSFENIGDYRDVETYNAYKMKKDEGLEEKEIIEILKQKSRDNSRTPLQWNSEKNSGFTSGVPWINTAANYKDINVEKALENKESIYYFYRRLIKLRKEEEILIEGKYEDIDIENKNVYAYKRSFKNDELIVIANFYSTECNFNISDNLLEYKILISNYNNIRLDSSNIIKLRPYESIMLKKIN